MVSKVIEQHMSRLGRRAWLFFIIGFVTVSSPTHGQSILQGQIGNIPNGSPLANQYGQQQQQQNTQTTNQSGIPLIEPSGNSVISGTSVIDDSRNLINIERSLQEGQLTPPDRIKPPATPSEFEA